MSLERIERQALTDGLTRLLLTFESANDDGTRNRMQRKLSNIYRDAVKQKMKAEARALGFQMIQNKAQESNFRNEAAKWQEVASEVSHVVQLLKE